MSSHRAFYGDRERAFALTPAVILELEAVTGTGIGAMMRRVAGQEFRLSDLQAVIRLALVGGGNDPETAARLVENYMPTRPLVEAQLLAVSILERLWLGAPADERDPDAGATLAKLSRARP